MQSFKKFFDKTTSPKQLFFNRKLKNISRGKLERILNPTVNGRSAC